MLKRLELIGFKSFADKTRFDFAPGITGIVGPNGSGKSNVVDAVRWILGEQSAKSLRGGEMVDVIFNGSSSRKSLGMAEVSVVFDNSRRLLAVDADEVQLTRRVYRDGTGEYLINGEAARLKDVKDIFLGSGATAYTIIAQGRVEELLQASPRDRREIFDEAAGISRFKAKKAETLRKLAAVEANLTRSRDRLDTLDARLRSLRMQAAKAQKFREYSDRLRDLRVALGMRDYQQSATALEAEQQRLTAIRGEAVAAGQRTAELEALLRTLERDSARTEDDLRQHEACLAEARERIVGFDSALRHEQAALSGFEAELLKLRRQQGQLGCRIRALQGEIARANSELTAAEQHLDREREAARRATQQLADAAARVSELEDLIARDREQHYEQVREAAAAQSTVAATRTQVERLQKEYNRKLGEIEQTAARREGLAETLAHLSQADADLQARLVARRDRLESLRTERDRLVQQAEAVQAALENHRVRQGDLRGRIEVLEELERTYDGLGAGVRAVLTALQAERGERAAEHPPADQGAATAATPQGHRPRLAAVLGLVADLLTVPHELAPFVELALGETAQRFVLRSADDLDAVVTALGELPGRVGFVTLRAPAVRTENGPAQTATSRTDPTSDPPADDTSTPKACPTDTPADVTSPAKACPTDTPADASIVSLARFVSSEVPGLAEQLIGHVVLVGTRADAHRLRQSRPDQRIVTRTGELFEPDGRISVGPPKSESGLVSRKSELRELRKQQRAVATQVVAAEAELAELRRRLDASAAVIKAAEAEIGLLSGEAGDLQQQIARHRQQVEQQDELLALLGEEARHLAEEVQKGEAALDTARRQAEQAERAAQQIADRLATRQEEQRQAEANRQAAQEVHTAAQVALSRASSDFDRAKDRLTQLESELRKRRVEAVDISAAIATIRERLLCSTLALLQTSAGLADAYRQKEDHERLIAELALKVAADRAAREALRDELETLGRLWRDRQNAAHSLELAVHDLQAKRDAIADRIREDYGLDLAELAARAVGRPPHPPASPDQQPEDGQAPDCPPTSGSPLLTDPAAILATLTDPHAEIEDLRRKITRLGAVNMEALEELSRVEAEYQGLQAQHDDLNAGRRALQETIEEINTTSRKLFTETLTAIRGYFQELFRKLFGGGQADIVLEDESDVLECGIEITARPPGKELRALSLLSGGEKTLTAVALLLAIFRNKPSPFCILDEVDAALDEANTQRLAGVLREFLDRSQFIIITHKKRTMAAADRLWGVTMQESGVSRLLSMRFEDWPEEASADTSAAPAPNAPQDVPASRAAGPASAAAAATTDRTSEARAA